jgi:hypothetical protein
LAAAAHPVRNEGAFIFGHGPANLEQQLIMGVVTHRPLQKLYLASVLGQLFEEHHLMDIVTCQSIRGGEEDPLERAQGGAIAQPIQARPIELGAAVPIISVDVVVRQMPVGLHHDMLAQASELLFNRLLLLLPIG